MEESNFFDAVTFMCMVMLVVYISLALFKLVVTFMNYSYAFQVYTEDMVSSGVIDKEGSTGYMAHTGFVVFCTLVCLTGVIPMLREEGLEYFLPYTKEEIRSIFR